MLGWHWMMDARECDAPDLADSARVAELLRRVPEVLGLTRVGDPQVFEHRDPSSGEVTLAGVVLIAESHFSLHVRPAQKFVHADLFSCARFDPGAALTLLQQSFGFQKHAERMITRGELE